MHRPATRLRSIRDWPAAAVAVTVLLGLVLGAGAAAPAPAAAAAAEPVTPSFTSAVDGYARYEVESGCDPVAKPGAQTVAGLLAATYGVRPVTYISRACSASNSGHEEGRSVDWMAGVRNPEDKAKADAFLAWLQAPDARGNAYANARRLGVAYVIYDSRKLYLWNTAAGWTEYSDCLRVRTGAEYDTTCHRDHVHLSLSWDGANQRTSWYTDPGADRTACEPAPVGTATASTKTRSGGLGYVPLTPQRLLDTRTGEGVPGGSRCWLEAGRVLEFAAGGRAGIPTSGVSAVVLNVTGTGARGGAWVGAYPAGTAWPGTSSVNLAGGGTASALVSVPVSSDGRVALRAGGAGTDVVVDAVGYFPSSGSGSRYTPVPAQRPLDARVAAASWTAVRPQVPASATAVVANVVMADAASAGYVSLVPGTVSSGRPATSTTNGAAGDIVANRAFAQLSDGALSVYSSARTREIVDVSGYFSSSGAGYVPLPPERIVHTRSGTGGLARLVGGQAVDVQVGGRGGVPVGASAAVVTVTTVDAAHPAFLTAWESGTPMPPTSDLNIPLGPPRANLFVLPLDSGGASTVRINAGSVDLIVDVLGYFR